MPSCLKRFLKLPFYFPKPTGQHAVGVKDYHWVDGDRKETFTNDPSHPNRELMINIWYPSSPSLCSWLRRTSSAQGKLQDNANQEYIPSRVKYEKSKSFIDWLKKIFSQSVYAYGIHGALISNTNTKHPVIILSPGFGCTADLYTAQCENLASNGFIVVGINHTYFCNTVKFPDGRIISKEALSEKCKKLRPIESFKLMWTDWIETLVADTTFVIDSLEKLNSDPKSMFFNRLDLDKIGMMGHSLGGSTTVQMCRRDPRIKAGVNMDARLQGPDATTGFNKPLMIMIARDFMLKKQKALTPEQLKKQDITPEEEHFMNQTYIPAIDQLIASMKSDVYKIIIKDMDHIDFSDMVLLKHTKCYADLFPGFGLGQINGFRATEIVNDYLVNFFNKYLKGQPSELLDGGDQRYAEVEAR